MNILFAGTDKNIIQELINRITIYKYKFQIIKDFTNIHILLNDNKYVVLVLNVDSVTDDIRLMINEIRKSDKDIVIIIITNKMNNSTIIKLLPLRIYKILKTPLNINDVISNLRKIDYELSMERLFLNDEII